MFLDTGKKTRISKHYNRFGGVAGQTYIDKLTNRQADRHTDIPLKFCRDLYFHINSRECNILTFNIKRYFRRHFKIKILYTFGKWDETLFRLPE